MRYIPHLLISAAVVIASPPIVRGDIIQPLPGKQLNKGPRGVNVEAQMRNEQSSFCVRIDVCVLDQDGNKIDECEDRILEEGQCMGVQVRSEESGYLYLLYKQADGAEKCLYPNKHDQDNRIPAGRELLVPTTTSLFRLRVAPPLGQETLIALVTKKPLSAAAFGGKSLTKDIFTDIDLDTVISKGVEVELRANPESWAEHSLKVTTIARRRPDPPAQPKKKRIGLFIGINKYKATERLTLHACVNDAKTMAKTMKDVGSLDGMGVLLDEQATLQNIKKACEELQQMSRPGDELFIFWSGHGGTCADTGGDERDGKDEFLVPYDVNPEKLQETVVMDDAFGRWIQELDGRRVVVILDACHSGGQFGQKGLDAAKELGDSNRIIKDTNEVNLDSFNALLDRAAGNTLRGASDWVFLGDELTRIKDIGQDDAAMLFSSKEDEISVERRDGKLSALTYFLVECIEGNERVTLSNAYDHVKVAVPKYVEANFPNRTQTPQLKGTGLDVRLR